MYVTFVFSELEVCTNHREFIMLTMMSIGELSQESLEDLYSALERVSTLDWKVLLTRWFKSLYSEDDVAMIESSVCPAKALLDDLTYRGITLQDLVEGLEAIGNNRAVSIIIKGAQKSGLDMQYSGRRPPPQVRSTGNPQEQEDSVKFSPYAEEAETLHSSVQVSEAKESACHSSDPGLHTSCLGIVLSIVSSWFPFHYSKA